MLSHASKLIWRYKYSQMQARSKFIVLEGLDRCGKTSISTVLKQELSTQENPAIGMAFPNRQSAIGQMINQFLNNKKQIGKQAVHLLFSANRWESMPEIQKNLQSGRNIVCDRYWYSGVAYSYAKGLDLQWCMAADQGLIEPNLVVLLKGDPIKLASRQGYGQERFERVEFQLKVAEGFDKLVRTLNKEYIKVVNVDGKSLEQVKEEVLQIVKKHLNEQK